MVHCLMSPTTVRLAIGVCFASALLSFGPKFSAAELPKWTVTDGSHFSGEPSAMLGPFALFSTSPTASKFVPLRALPPAEIERFKASIEKRPRRSGQWSSATGAATSELAGGLLQREATQFLPVNLSELPEPELMVVVLGARRSGRGDWRMWENIAPFANRLQRVYPGRIATVMITDPQLVSVRYVSRGERWYVPDKTHAGPMKVLSQFVPAHGIIMVLMTRDGVPLVGGPANDVGDVMSFVDQASALLWRLTGGRPPNGVFADPQLAADAAWVIGEARIDVPLTNWLVLKPIHVPEDYFGGIDHVGPNGVVMLKPVPVRPGKSTGAQISSFVRDWFADVGAVNVHPKAGQPQEVDGEKLVWERMPSHQGLVNLLDGDRMGSMDYCIGYAWTEIDVPQDTDAWLGIGSDDGVRVWHNGQLVVDQWILRQSRLDDDVVALRLTKGKNQFLIKIQNATGLWSFTCRLRMRGTEAIPKR
jgi:hypothetical protein